MDKKNITNQPGTETKTGDNVTDGSVEDTPQSVLAEKAWYDNGREHLADLFSAIAAREKEKTADKEGHLYRELVARIRTKEKASREREVKLPLDVIRQKYRLDDNEAMIIVELLYAKITSQRHEALSKNEMISAVAGKNWMNTIAFQKYLLPESPLLSKKLITCDSRFMQVDYEISAEVAEMLMEVEEFHNNLTATTMVMKPAELYARLSEWVVGQEEAKKWISVALSAHLQRNSQRDNNKKLGKSNILLVGPTGCGKTYLCKTIAKILDVPMITVDASSYTETGYVGADVSDMIRELLRAAAGNTKLAEKGIIYIDEIDKIAARRCRGHRTDRDVSGESVQYELLTLVEGSRNGLKWDTSGILFIAGGAFSGIENIEDRKKSNQNNIGFGCSKRRGITEENRSHRVTSGDLIAYGMIPEFIGRFPAIVSLEELNEDELLSILCGTGAPLIEEYKTMFSLNNGLEIRPGALKQIAHEAKRRGLGARGLRAVLDETLSPILFDRALASGGGPLVISEDDIAYGEKAAIA